MATKLVSANMGIRLVVEQDGEQKIKEYTITTNQFHQQPSTLLGALCKFVNEEFGTDLSIIAYDKINVPIAKPKRIKARRKPISHEEFNRRITELGK